MANINYALIPYTQEAGSLAIVPGSDKSARQPRLAEIMVGGEQGNPDAISLDLSPVDAVIWHGNTWHGSFVRETPGMRINLAAFFAARIYSPRNVTEISFPVKCWPATRKALASTPWSLKGTPMAGSPKDSIAR